jgi:hypothetical protein
MGANSAPGLVWWTVMVVGTMVPLTLPAVRTVALNSLQARRYRGVGSTSSPIRRPGSASAPSPWRPGGLASAGRVHDSPPAFGTALLVAAGWELTR